LERFGEKKADNLLASILASKKVSLGRFIFSLGIPHVGEETANRLAEVFGSLTLFRSATSEQLEAVRDVGPRVAESVVAYFAEAENRLLLSRLVEYGVLVSHKKIEQTADGPLFGKRCVITGSLSGLTRDEAKDRIRSSGGVVVNSVSKNTDYIIVGASPGSKLDKAHVLGVTVLAEEDFLRMTNPE